MVKSRAEIRREYRKRLKEKDKEGYLRKERERRRGNYVPSHLLSTKERAERRQKIRDSVRQYRKKKKQELERANTSADLDTSGYESISGSTGNRERLFVSMRFPNRSKGSKVRLSNELSDAQKVIMDLKKANIDLARKLKTEQRRRQRVLKRLKGSPGTPRRKAERLMNEAGLTTRQKNKVRKEIVFGNAVAEQMGQKRQEHTNGTVKGLHMLLAGEIMRKYRLNSALCAKTGLNKCTLSKYSSPCHSSRSTDAEKTRRKHETKIVEFLERDDNSRAQPGKADALKSGGQIKQTRVLTDYMKNLHEKFLSENPETTISFAPFCRVRPRHILLSAYISRSSCLCTRHQNMALTAKTLRREGLHVAVNPETFAKGDLDVASIMANVSDNISVPQWKRVKIDDRGKQKSVMRIQESVMTKEEFSTHIESQKKEFSEHVDRMKAQYFQIRHLKQNLPANQTVIHMDFAENYSCRSSEEIQSAYFNQTCVTLHPAVLYYKQNDDLLHKSIVIVSDTTAHNANTVIAFLDAIIPEVKILVPDVHVCHYWTDSQTSQYRNKQIFDTVANHLELYGCSAVWNNFESGHGKDPCDGLGGTVKRMADTAVKTGQAMIQDATDFFTWATEKSSFENVTFKFVPDEEISEKVSQISNVAQMLRPVKGTMKIHSVAGAGKSTVWVRDTSCYCDLCLSGEHCNGWRKERTRKDELHVAEKSGRSTGSNKTAGVHAGVNDFVAAVYESDWFVGQVVDTDEEDGEVEISFMERRKHLYRWPRLQDRIWVSSPDILCVIHKPTETCKSKRMFRLAEEDEAKIAALFNAR